MSARTYGAYRYPVTLAVIRQESTDKADFKAGEIPVMVRPREIPTAYDDMHFSRWQGQVEAFKAQTARHNAHWASLGYEPYYYKKTEYDTREKINLLEHRRTARKTSLERKSFQYDPDNNVCSCEPGICCPACAVEIIQRS
jgi:hypothetical protein